MQPTPLPSELTVSRDRIGVIADLLAIADVSSLGLSRCQLKNWKVAAYDELPAVERAEAAAAAGVRIDTLWAGYPQPVVWDFVDGPRTIGLVPGVYRDVRVDALERGIAYAAEIGTPAVATHVGFIPENADDPLYRPVVDALKQLAGAARRQGLEFWFETGQETPVTLLRTIEDIGLDNLGINLDPANLILYGKANPIDALEVFGRYVRCIHVKDGRYPTNGRELGEEVLVGTGRVDYPRFLERLAEIGFDGPLIIEREISGAEQRRDILTTIDYLTGG